jgi:hypothetical protein
MSRRLARTLAVTVALAALGILANAPSALAYGSSDQWQAGFSGTCSSQSSCPFGPTPATGASGFWGWCAFGGSNGSSAVGTTGNTADCQVTTYFGSGTSFHIDYNVDGWVIQASSPLTGGLPDFLFTSGTVTLSGPGTPPFLPQHVAIPFPSPCPIFVCDSGIPSIPGHFSFHPSAGVELEIQVTKLS